MARKRDESRVAEASRLYHSKGLTQREVAAIMGVDQKQVSRWLAGTGRRTGPRGRADVPDAKIIVMMGEGAGPTEIARATGLSRGAVRKRIARLRGGGDREFRCPCCGAKLDVDSVTVQTGADAPMCWDCGLYATDPPEDCDNEDHRA